MGVYKRGRYYWVSFTYQNQQVRESAKTTHKRTAEILLAKRQLEIFENRYFPEKKKKSLTIEQLRDLWLTTKAGKKSISDDEQRFRRIVGFFGPARRISQITPENVEALLSHLQETPNRNKQPMKPATVNRYLVLLRAALNLASKRDHRHQDPFKTVELLREDNERDRICSPAEYATLFKHASPELRLAVVLGYWTGMRLGEIANLRWEQIDFHRATITLLAKDTKTSSRRLVPLMPEASEALKGAPRNMDGRVLRLQSSSLSQAFNKLCKRLKIKGLRFHDLRHTAATNLRRAGVDIYTIQAITGHKSLETLKRYNTVTLGDSQAAFAKIAKRE